MSAPLSLHVEKCLIASLTHKPDTQVVDSAELFQLVNPTSPYAFMNGIYRTKLSAQDAAPRIADLYRFYREQGISFRWYVFPHHTPADLAARLQTLGPTTVTEMQGLWASTDDSRWQTPERVTVELLSERNLDEFVETSNAGWSQTDKIQAEKYRREITESILGSDGTRLGFLARYDGIPAATGFLKIVGDRNTASGAVGYLYGGSTREEFRKRGVYRGLLARRIQHLCEMKIPLVMILARKSTSAPICRSLGFEVACECQCFEYHF